MNQRIDIQPLPAGQAKSLRCGYWPCGWCRSKDRCDQAKESRSVCRFIWWVIALEVAGVAGLLLAWALKGG